jgi:hypothetical protein
MYLLMGQLSDRDFRDVSFLVNEDDVVGALRDDDDAGLVSDERHLRNLLRDFFSVLRAEVVRLGENFSFGLVAKNLEIKI